MTIIVYLSIVINKKKRILRNIWLIDLLGEETRGKGEIKIKLDKKEYK